ncbi:uncharacterized, partial [Tachysurus ichikawai]
AGGGRRSEEEEKKSLRLWFRMPEQLGSQEHF